MEHGDRLGRLVPIAVVVEVSVNASGANEHVGGLEIGEIGGLENGF